MTNQFNLNTIKNLNFIYLYEMPYSNALESNKTYYGLKIIINNNEVIEFNHKDAIFKDFINKVYDLYQIEKGRGRTIAVVGDITQKFLEDKEFVKDNHIIVMPNKISAAHEKYPLDDTFENQILSTFIYRFLNVLMTLLNKEEVNHNFKINSGFKERKTISYLENNETKYIPIVVVKKDDNVYELKLLLSLANFYSIYLQVRIMPDEVTLNFKIEDTKIEGEIKYSLNYYNNEVTFLEDVNIVDNEKLIATQTNNIQVSKMDDGIEKLIKDLLTISDINFDPNTIRVYRVGKDTYFIDDLTVNAHTEKDDVITDINGIVKISDEEVAIKYVITKFIYQYSNSLKVILDNADIDIDCKLIHTPTEESDYVVCQRYYNNLNNANVNYMKEMAGHFADDIYLVPANYSFYQGIENLAKIDTPDDYKKRYYIAREEIKCY